MTTALAMDGRMLVLDLEAALNRLPAALRAKFRWSAPQLRGALRRLVEEPLSDALLDETAESLFEPMMSLGATFLDLVNTDRTLLAALGADVERDLERLRAYLHDDEAEDTLAWIVAFWKSCLDGVSRESAHTHAFGPSDFAALRADPAMRLLLRCEVASFGVLECVKRELPTERAVELLDAAFLDMMSLRELLSSAGFETPLRFGRTEEEEGAARVQHARRAREGLTSADWQAIESARVGDLR